MKVYLDTVGCRLNQAELETMARQFRAAGHEIVATADNAELAVVNTCAVTSAAASDSRSTIRRLARVGGIDIVATGCWATLQPERAAALPRVSRVVANERKDYLASDVLNLPDGAFAMEPPARTPLPGLHRRTRAFIKVQDGCDNRCAFCITTLARGTSRSRSLCDVIGEVRAAVEGGSREVVLTGVHLGSWGQEFGLHLRHLVQAILRETAVPRLRLSSLEPWDLDASFFSLWDDPRLCRHLHLPLQSGCASTLRRMVRKTTPACFRQLLAAAREIMPDVALTTDLIAGFPGETEAEFAESLDFVREMNFAGGHAFTYSPRPETRAARMPDQVRPSVRRARTSLYRTHFAGAALVYRQRMIGQTASVLWESATRVDDRRWQLEGFSGNYVRVSALGLDPCWNEIQLVEMAHVTPEGLTGSILKSG